MDAGLFAVSASLLTLEILQTRIFSYSLSQIASYLAIGVCLLGLGASATALAAFPAVTAQRARRLASAFAAAGALAIPASHAFFAHRDASLEAASELGFTLIVALTLPYLGYGAAIALLMVARSAEVGRAYAANLAGSALGCILVFPLLDLVGAEAALGVIAGATLLSAALIQWPDSWPARAGFAAVAAVLIASHLSADRLFAFPPDPRGHLGWVRRAAESLHEKRTGSQLEFEQVHSVWDRTGKIDVYRMDSSIPEIRAHTGGPIETLFVVHDSTAGSYLLGVGDDLGRARPFFDETIYAAGYSVGRPRDALIIGVGGGPDMLTALYQGAEHVVGVEINESMIAVGRDVFADFQGNPYARPGVEVHRVDGRTFLEATDQTFDLIQLSSVDTKNMVASGSLALTNNYLYTREAMSAMLERLRPGGTLAIMRAEPSATWRVISTAVAGLRDVGVTAPERHIMVLGQAKWRSVLVKPRPFEAQEIARVNSWVEERGSRPDVVMPHMSLVGNEFDGPMQVLYSPDRGALNREKLLVALGARQLESFVSDFAYDLRPPTDDWPFFFFMERVDRSRTGLPDVLKDLFGISLRMAVVSAFLIGLPLVAIQRRGLRAPLAVRSLAYFTCIGLGFMLVEIGLIHRFVLLLGHQSYAVTVVLFGLLVGASLGSFTSGRLSIAGPASARWVLAAVLAVVVALAYGLDPVFSVASQAGFPARLAVASSLLIGLGFVLGMPFPLALRSLGGANLSLVAWGIGVNGLASVVGSTIAVPISMITGLQVVLLSGAGLYAFALLVVPIARTGSPART